ncbi:MAG TPA: hypothetical protein VFR49_12045 [Solirubrobacteraceae bacterium]|nr:hypothetical protein [Solirubrobacteraceae bacterium]
MTAEPPGEPVARPHPEPVVLDIGGTLGALVVHASADLLDTPIEISRAGHDAERAHQHVLERPLPAGSVYAAVFDRIEAGAYTLWLHDEVRARDVLVEAGTVTELRWTDVEA